MRHFLLIFKQCVKGATLKKKGRFLWEKWVKRDYYQIRYAFEGMEGSVGSEQTGDKSAAAFVI